MRIERSVVTAIWRGLIANNGGKICHLFRRCNDLIEVAPQKCSAGRHHNDSIEAMDVDMDGLAS